MKRRPRWRPVLAALTLLAGTLVAGRGADAADVQCKVDYSVNDWGSGFTANLTLTNADQVVSQIALATKAADRALDKLQSIDKAVNIASSVIVLAMAISTKDPGQIESAARAVAKAAGLAV